MKTPAGAGGESRCCGFRSPVGRGNASHPSRNSIRLLAIRIVPCLLHQCIGRHRVRLGDGSPAVRAAGDIFLAEPRIQDDVCRIQLGFALFCPVAGFRRVDRTLARLGIDGGIPLVGERKLLDDFTGLAVLYNAESCQASGVVAIAGNRAKGYISQDSKRNG